MGGASTLSNQVEAAGSRLEVGVWELCDSFGIVRLTPAGRERIARELGARGLRLEPPLARLGLDERVTIVGPRPRLRLVTAPADPGPAPSAPPEPWESDPPVDGERPRRPFWSHRRRTVMAGVAAGLLVTLLIVVFGWNVGKEGSEAGSNPAPAAAASPPAPAGAEGHPKVVASLQEVDDALAEDHPDAASRILSGIDPGVLSSDPDLALQARILRNRIRFTESYLDATALAGAGRYAEARTQMLALVPFRDAGLRARLYGVEIAKSLVAQARTEAAVRPDHALALLEQAQDIAPSLSEITEVRTEVGG